MTIGSKETIQRRIGEAQKSCCLRQNIPQNVIAERSGISPTAGLGEMKGTDVLREIKEVQGR